jgi:sulfite reductase alpha subunit-like flavoprotein
VYVLYGSQTGNSKSLSEDFTAKLVEDSVPAICLSLNEVKNFPFKEKAICILVVCSTTGNADCPENADVWWRSVKVRSLVN